MTLWQVCHQSGRVLFTMTARNREQFGWKVIEVDKSREQFEQWVINENKLRLSAHDNPLKRCANSYYYGWVSSAWEVWQASRAAIEIELPPTVDGSNVPFAGNAWNAYRSEAVNTIRAAGIKVKE